jgi:hypothetical protein
MPSVAMAALERNTGAALCNFSVRLTRAESFAI